MLELSFDPFPVLETERLILRRPRESDAHPYFLLRSDEEIMKFLDRRRASNVDEIVELLKKIEEGILSNTRIAWSVEDKSGAGFIGTVSFHNIYPEHFRAEVGYLFDKAFWGKGIAPEAVDAVMHYGFTKMNLHSIEANVNPENKGSIRVLEKLKFVKEAHFKENYFWDGKFLDTAIYSRIKN